MKTFLHTLTGLCLIRLTADLILPEGDARRWVDLGAGLLTMLCMIRTLISVFRGAA